MTRLLIKKLVWDEWNVEHIKRRHQVSKEEVEESIKNALTHTKGKRGKYIVIGRSGVRIISTIVGKEVPGEYYPVSARDASKKERIKLYEKEKKQTT